MTKMVDLMDGLTLKDLMSEDGLIINVDGELQDDDEDFFKYNRNANLTNSEMIKLLNMEEFAADDEDDDDLADTGERMMPWSLSFEKIKLKSEKLTSDGKVMKLVKQNGVGEVAGADSLVAYHYGGYFEHQDEPFDSTFARGQPDRKRLNQGELILGLELGLRTMKKHETSCFIIHPDYAFGELGCVPLIPPAAEVLFIVHILDIVDSESPQTFDNLSAQDKKLFRNIKGRVEVLLRTAAESFKRTKTRQAIREYSRAAEALQKAHLDNDEEENELNRLLSRVYGNLAICFNKEDKPRQACRSCLSVPNPTAKTHFHHGRALIKMGEYKRALEELQCSLTMDPGNVRTIQEMRLASDLQTKYVESEKRLWKNCLQLRSGDQELRDYAVIAKEFCETFEKNDAILRQSFPDGLTPTEDKCIRQQAALLGLTVANHVRYGKEMSYLEKPSYRKN